MCLHTHTLWTPFKQPFPFRFLMSLTVFSSQRSGRQADGHTWRWQRRQRCYTLNEGSKFRYIVRRFWRWSPLLASIVPSTVVHCQLTLLQQQCSVVQCVASCNRPSCKQIDCLPAYCSNESWAGNSSSCSSNVLLMSLHHHHLLQPCLTGSGLLCQRQMGFIFFFID